MADVSLPTICVNINAYLLQLFIFNDFLKLRKHTYIFVIPFHAISCQYITVNGTHWAFKRTTVVEQQ